MEIKKLLFASLVYLTSIARLSAQDYQIGQTSLDFVDTARNRTIPVSIYYPSDASGNDVSFPVSGNEEFPLIVFGHGFVMSVDAYDYVWQMLVPKGFIVVFPKTEGGLLPSHNEFAKDLAYSLTAMEVLNADETAIFYGRVAPFNAIMGHSMGGGAAFLAAELAPSASALVTLAAAETNPSAIAASANLNLSSLVLAAGNDCVTPPESNQIPMYEALQSGCKTFINIVGGSHCQMADSNFLCGLGEATCGSAPTISRTFQHQIISDYLVPWLKAQLNQDCEFGSTFNDLIASDNRITFDKNCDQCEALAVNEVEKSGLQVFPNPFYEYINLEIPSLIPTQLVIYDAYSRVILQQLVRDQHKIPTHALSSGIYFYKLIQSDQLVKTGKLVKK